MIFWIFIALIVLFAVWWAYEDQHIGSGAVAALISSVILGPIFFFVCLITSSASEDGETTRHELGVMSIDGGEDSVAVINPDGKATFVIDGTLHSDVDNVTVLESEEGNYVDVADYEFKYWWLAPFSFDNGTEHTLHVERGGVGYVK